MRCFHCTVALVLFKDSSTLGTCRVGCYRMSISRDKPEVRLPWLASAPSSTSELVCVGKIKLNGVSQSLFIDRYEWPPKTGTGQHINVEVQSKPPQTHAAAAAGATAHKVICISPAPQSTRRCHSVIRRAVPTSCHHAAQDNGSSDAAVIEVTSAQRDQAVHPTAKRIFDQDAGPFLRSAGDATMKVARVADTDALAASAAKVLPGTSVLLPGTLLKANANSRNRMRPLLPRSGDPIPGCAKTNVITIVPASSSSVPNCDKPAVASSVVIPLNRLISSCTVAPSSAHSADDGSEGRSEQELGATKSGAGNAAQLMQRIRLIECEVVKAEEISTSTPFYINVMPLQSTDAEGTPPVQSDGKAATTTCSTVPDAVAADDDDANIDEQLPEQMLEALRLIRKPQRDVIVTSSSSTGVRDSAAENTRSLAPAASAAVKRLVTMKLVNRAAQRTVIEETDLSSPWL